MKKARKMPELILQLKAVKAERGLKNPDIVELLHQKGYFISISTVKRVFAEGSEHHSFWYEESVRPIEEVLLIDAAPTPVEELESLEDAHQYVSQIEGLQAVASFKDELMEELSSNNDELKVSVEEKDLVIESLEKELSSYKKKLWFVVSAFIGVVLLFFAYLVIHVITHP